MQAGGWRDTDRCSPEAGSSSPEAESAPTASIVSVVGELKSSLVHATKSFKEVVQQRSTNVKAQQERKKECVAPTPHPSR